MGPWSVCEPPCGTAGADRPERVLTGPATSAQIEAARGQLTPFLRDTLVGLNYAYYEPPGAQILHVNSLFVRTHDFLGTSVIGADCTWRTPQLVGVGVSAGGGAYLMGSLADLPYSLAAAEAAFVVPEHIQALVWELIPNLLAGATVPRWWNVSPEELHAVALYQESGEELMSAARANEEVRSGVLEILSDQVGARRLEEIERGTSPKAEESHVSLMPSETFYLAEELLRRSPAEVAAAGPAGKQLAALAASNPGPLDPGRLSADFGVSHLTLARTNARELLHVQPFPFSTGSTNRTFAESLESNNLYWARLADESGYPPVVMNRLTPELTRHMVAKIFATNMEDWPAVMRAMQATRDDLQKGKIAGFARAAPNNSSQPAADTSGGNAQRMVKKGLVLVVAAVSQMLVSRPLCPQENASHLKVQVVLVELSLAVTDAKGNYVTGLRPEDFVIMEDKIPEKIRTFEEGGVPARVAVKGGADQPPPAPGRRRSFLPEARPNLLTGTPQHASTSNVFILFDTSDYMYRGFVLLRTPLQTLSARLKE